VSLTGPVPLHPAEFSPEVIDSLRLRLKAGERVHDPFAGRGVRLGALCDELGCEFSGTDIEVWEDSDPRVLQGNSGHAFSYPPRPFIIVTSPVYLNRISTDYVDGPKDTTKPNGRRAYGVSLGRPLDRDNLARLARRPEAFYAAHAEVVRHWDHRVLLNVDLPMSQSWRNILNMSGYRMDAVTPVPTKRYRGPANSDKRPENEVLIVASRTP
jgi:hypothetical protein